MFLLIYEYKRKRAGEQRPSERLEDRTLGEDGRLPRLVTLMAAK
jgi:hypothetical protein